MAPTAEGMAMGFGLIALLWCIPLLVWWGALRKAHRAAEALGLQPEPEASGRKPRYHGWLEARPLRLANATTDLGRNHWLVLETECAMPPGFTLVLGDHDVARKRGVPVRGLRELRTGWKHFDGWAWPRSSEQALALAFLKRCRLALNAAPLAALWFHGGRAGLAADLFWLRPDEAPKLARTLARRVADLEHCARSPEAQAAALEPDATPEQHGPGEDEPPEQVA